MSYHLAAIITCLALLLFVFFAYRVGGARKKYGIASPATTGNREFEIIFRIHQNTMEQLVVFLPALWLFSMYVSKPIGALFGLVWIVGRILYALGYQKEPKKRLTGFVLTLGSSVIMTVWALVVIIIQLIQTS